MTGNAQQHGSTPNTQDAVLDFLETAEPGVTRIDTHASIVFLGADRVLKVKRAIRLPFLDYSSLDRRLAACQAELNINRPFAPDLYRRVIPITQDLKGLTIDGAGEPVEWAVEMKRFDETAGLDCLAAKSGIAPEMAEQIADAIIASHDRASAADGSNWLESIANLIARNTDKFRDVGQLTQGAVNALHDASMAALEAARPALAGRAADGFVRRCHGDLHLGNITLIDGKPVLFDAIEFDPALATTDVLYDLSFPLMDMLHYGQSAAANALFNRYLLRSDTRHLEALALFPLFLSIRAAIRAHVLFTKADLPVAKSDSASAAQRYFDLAVRFIHPSSAAIVAVGGMSGTGKSVLARAIAPALGPAPGAVIIRSDVMRKTMFGLSEQQRLSPSAYSAEVTAEVYALLMRAAATIASQGHAVVIDAAFLLAKEREAFARIKPEFVAHLSLFLQAPLDIRLGRIASRHGDASDATTEVARKQETCDPGELKWPIVDAGGTPEQTLAIALRHLAPLAAAASPS